MEEIIRRKYPGNTLHKKRVQHLAVLRLKALDACLAAAIRDEHDATVALRARATSKYFASLQESMHDLAGGFIVDVNPLVVAQKECAHFTMVSTHLWISWQCRNKMCSKQRGAFYGPNDADTWLQDAQGEEHFRCPVCKVLYEPWTDKIQNGEQMYHHEMDGGKTLNPEAIALPYQRVLIFTNPLSGAEQAIPVTWPNNREDRWINDQLEAMVLKL